ncbi:MAG TPA: glycosyltransferase family 4 protein, partial [bacterium]|nr:glycosyltransferase family 4 protein [bacterium]
QAHRLEAYRTGVLPHHLHVIPPGVDLQRFSPGERPAELASRLAVGRGGVLVTVAGGPATDLLTVFRAFAAIRGAHRSTSLVVVGAADERHWKKELRQLRVDRSVHFTGPVPPGDMPDHFRLGDLYLAAHKEDPDNGVAQGCGLPLVEAQACGLPVVATRTPVTEEVAPPGEVGTLVEPEAHAKLAKAAGDLLGADDRRTALAAAAREHAEQVHDARVTAADFRELREVIYLRRLGLGNHEPTSSPEGSGRSAA